MTLAAAVTGVDVTVGIGADGTGWDEDVVVGIGAGRDVKDGVGALIMGVTTGTESSMDLSL